MVLDLLSLGQVNRIFADIRGTPKRKALTEILLCFVFV
jgi:hypothetical protein